MIVETSYGGKYEIDEAALDDMEVLEGLMDLDEGKMSGLRKTMTALLGDKGKEILYENHRKNGRVSAAGVIAEVKEIFDLAPQALKNSSPSPVLLEQTKTP